MTVSADVVPDDPSKIIAEIQPRFAIPDADFLGVVSTLDVSEAGVIASIDVSVTILHTFIGDLEVRLTSPDGKVVTVFEGDWQPTDNLIETFSSADHDGLEGLHGDNVSGSWTLRVIDRIGADTGTLERWGLSITLQP
jgi:subtilisin-like proprotein convertase family protein